MKNRYDFSAESGSGKKIKVKRGKNTQVTYNMKCYWTWFT